MQIKTYRRFHQLNGVVLHQNKNKEAKNGKAEPFFQS